MRTRKEAHHGIALAVCWCTALTADHVIPGLGFMMNAGVYLELRLAEKVTANLHQWHTHNT